MLKFRRIAKKVRQQAVSYCSANVDCGREELPPRKKNPTGLIFFYSHIDNRIPFPTLIKETFPSSSSFQADLENWLLWGVIPAKEANIYGSDDEYFDLSPTDAENLFNDIINYAQDRLLSYIAYQERAVSECRHYLQHLPVNKSISDNLIHKAIENNYINDRRFAELLTQSAISRNRSSFDAKSALIAKRIAPDIIEEMIHKFYDAETGVQVLEHHIEKGIRKYPDPNSYKDYHKCIAYLIKKGFQYGSFVDKLRAYYTLEE